MLEAMVNANAINDYLTFCLNEERYAIPVVSVEVVLEMVSVTRVPSCPPHLRGVLNYRGSVIPVIDVKNVFGMGVTDLSAFPTVIVSDVLYEGEKVTVGLLADEVQEVLSLDSSLISNPPGMKKNEEDSYINGIARHGDGFIILPDLSAALDSISLRTEK